MNHSFDIENAKKYGVIEAILLENFYHWLRVNYANGKNIRDGRPWTYNSVRAYADLFPYLSGKQIRRAIDSLVEKGALIKGEYNKANYDKTSWYSVPDIAVLAIRPKGQMDLPEKANRSAQMGEPIPDINTDKKPNAAAADFSIVGKGFKPTKTTKEPKVKKARDFSAIEPVLNILRKDFPQIEKAISLNTKRMIEHEIEEHGMEFVSDAVYGRMLTVKGTDKPLALTAFFDPDRAEWRADMANIGKRSRGIAEWLKMASQPISQPVIEYSEGEYIENPWQTSNT